MTNINNDREYARLQCDPAVCMNGKCHATGQCQDVPVVASPSLVPDKPRTIVAFTGLAGSGKSTAALHLVERHGWQRVRFAGPLKDMMRALGLNEREIEGDLKEKPCALLTREHFTILLDRVDSAFAAIGVRASNDYKPIVELCDCSYGYARDTFIEVLSWIVADGGKNGATPRRAMQMVGTEWGRQRIGEDVWIRLWNSNLCRVPAGVNVVVDDCRFPNEAAAVLAIGGVLVKVVRPGAGAGAAGHSSEGQALPDPTVIINNHGTQSAFLWHVDGLMCNLSWTQAAASSSE